MHEHLRSDFRQGIWLDSSFLWQREEPELEGEDAHDARLHLDVSLFEDFEDAIEGTLEIGRVGNVDDEAAIAIVAGNGVAIRKQDVYELLTMIGARFDVERFEVRWTKELCIDDERPNGQAVAIVAKFVQSDVFGDGVGILIIEKGCHSSVTIVITGLGLSRADAAELQFRVEWLVGARAE